ncbi:MAG: UDP-3-O-acyl-N-acetylglucosamine deacetylase [Bacteroidaceae bacterium]|nr:UDP-3-O-acyl-N-acetylglucosamine deacetylase [Bacteroidaceae bacterium]
MKQLTLSRGFSLSGKGLHTGLEMTVTFLPAPAGHGYKICRTDLEGRPVLDALAENVIDTTRGTVLGNWQFRCSTVEHALSALYSAGVDNVLIEVNGPEFPILDGSAEPYITNLRKVGLTAQDMEKKCLEIKEPMEVRDDETGSTVSVLPAKDFRLTVTIDFNSELLPMQTASLSSMKDFAREIASARTFVFVRDIQPLLNLGLIKGGDLENAIVIYETETSQENMDKLCQLTGVGHYDATELGYMQYKPLVWENEPARHKLLDLIGDLSLVGMPIKGHIVATKPGHTINNIFARKLRKLI